MEKNQKKKNHNCQIFKGNMKRKRKRDHLIKKTILGELGKQPHLIFDKLS